MVRCQSYQCKNSKTGVACLNLWCNFLSYMLVFIAVVWWGVRWWISCEIYMELEIEMWRFWFCWYMLNFDLFWDVNAACKQNFMLVRKIYILKKKRNLIWNLIMENRQRVVKINMKRNTKLNYVINQCKTNRFWT